MISPIEEFETYKLTFKIAVLRKNGRVNTPNVVVYVLRKRKPAKLLNR